MSYNKKPKTKARTSRTPRATSSRNTSLTVTNIEPLTENQAIAMDLWDEDSNLVLKGTAGTGKTFLALYLALSEMATNPEIFRKILIIRSAVQGRDMGFMPGDLEEKMGYYEAVYKDIVNEIHSNDTAYDTLKTKKLIEFSSTSFLRGLTYANTLVIVDECQNMAWNELHAILTRIGADSRLILCGDTAQDDLTSERFKEQSGLDKLIAVLKIMDKKSIEVVNFTGKDIVRSDFVKDYILALEKYESGTNINIVKFPGTDAA